MDIENSYASEDCGDSATVAFSWQEDKDVNKQTNNSIPNSLQLYSALSKKCKVNVTAFDL